jgi:AmmeMemoRadiSam system protein B
MFTSFGSLGRRKKVRRATHGGRGGWYSDDPKYLAAQLSGWLEAAGSLASNASSREDVRAIIGPHAGLSYSGETAAHAYTCLRPSQITRIFLLGPSHHFWTDRCLLSTADAYATPFGDIEIDKKVYAELEATGMFGRMDMKVDEAEHSLELHLPFISLCMRDRAFTLVPIMVGSCGDEAEVALGRILAPYLEDPSNFFVVSSDFCHWGQRFGFTWCDLTMGPIHKSIEWLDRRGMDLISAQDIRGWKRYLKEYENTICGRHPISLIMRAIDASASSFAVAFVKYTQSDKCCGPQDESVSYASAKVSITGARPWSAAAGFTCGPVGLARPPPPPPSNP